MRAARPEVVVAAAAFRVAELGALLERQRFCEVELVRVARLKLFQFFGGKSVIKNYALPYIQPNSGLVAFE